jgi:hypothetical protein
VASQKALSAPLTLSDNKWEDSRLAKFSHHRMLHTASSVRQVDANATEHPGLNSTRAQVPFNAFGTRFSGSPGMIGLKLDRIYRSQSYPADHSSLAPASDGSQQPSFHERPFPKGTSAGRTRWFRSSSPQQLVRPNEDLPAIVGDLYFHTNTCSGTTYAWILHHDEGWVPVEQGCDHPTQTMPKRRLRIRKDGDPSWVTIRSLISMQSRERH